MRRFAFIIHPRDTQDLRRGVARLLGRRGSLPSWRWLDDSLEWLLGRTRGRLGHMVASRIGVDDAVEGFLVGLFLTPRRLLAMPRREVRERILSAVLFAQDRLGAEHVGLGAYTAPLTDAGRSVAADPRVRAHVTHGDSLTAAMTVSTIRECARRRGLDLGHSTVAVVGGYGIVGRGVALLLADHAPARLLLTGRNRRRLAALRDEVLARGYQGSVVTTQLNARIVEAEIVVLCTSEPRSIVTAGMLARRAIVVDVVQPCNMGPEVTRRRPDVLRVDGGLVSLPGIDLGFEMGLPRRTGYACLVETMLSAMLGVERHAVGPVDPDHARSLMERSRELGFTVAPLTCFGRPLLTLHHAVRRSSPGEDRP